MTMQFHYHPLSSFCWKVLIALYEKNAAFEPVLVNLGDPEQDAAFRKLSPMRKMPALVNGDDVVNESSIEIEYLDRIIPQPRLIPPDAKQALDVRYWDRFFDVHMHYPMQDVVADRLRPKDNRDPFGVAANEAKLTKALDVLEAHMKNRTWASGDDFSMADCAALPPLYYINLIIPFGQTHPNATAYLERLKARPSVARTLREAEPFFQYFPREDAA